MANLTEDILNTQGGGLKEMALSHSITGDEDYLDRTLAEFDLVPLTIVQAKNGDNLVYLEMTGDKAAFFEFA
ncbi:MAG TPA: hypothetical protein ENJ56_01970 [Anaerolineae bacterium]|nr:hypothetical protein [Anaerolineae bacterium]